MAAVQSEGFLKDASGPLSTASLRVAGLDVEAALVLVLLW